MSGDTLRLHPSQKHHLGETLTARASLTAVSGSQLHTGSGALGFLALHLCRFYFTDVETEFRKSSHLAQFPGSSGAGFEYRSATVSRAKNSDRPASEGLPGEVGSVSSAPGLHTRLPARGEEAKCAHAGPCRGHTDPRLHLKTTKTKTEVKST